MAFTVTLSGPSASPISIDFATTAGSATAEVDYTSETSTIDIAPGDTSAQVSIKVLGDVLDEIDETFTVDLSNPSNVAIADGSAVGTILDDDPLPSLSIGDASVTEGDSGTTDAVFTVSLSTPSGRPVSVTYTTTDDTAKAGEDYVAVTGSVTIKAGDTTVAIVVQVNGDLVEEPDETFIVTLVDPGAAILSDDRVGIGTILNDDGPPELSIDDIAVIEGNDGKVPATFTVTLSAPSTDTVSVDWATVAGTALADEDYAFARGTLTFAPGDTTALLTVEVLGDLLDEFNERFTVELANPTNAAIGTGTGTGTIRDDDPLPSLSIDDTSVVEGDAGTTPATFTVVLSAPSGREVTVDFSTVSQSAVAGEDYTSLTGTLTFAPGDTSEQISIAVTGDTTVESDETFRVDLAGSVSASISDGSGTATITNDDAPDIAIDDVSVAEGDSGTSPATFTVTLSEPGSTPITVDWSTLGLDAAAGSDYDGALGTVTFAPGDTSEPITITVLGDTMVEADETFSVLLSNANGATIADGTGTGTILNDDVTADVSIVKTADHDVATDPVGAGQRLVYTLAITNQGPGPAANVQITDGLPHTSVPNDAAYCEVVSPATSCDTTVGTTYATATSIAPIATLAVGETRTFQIGYSVNAAAPSGLMENIASISTGSTDANPFNDSSGVTVRVNAPPVASFTFSPSVPLVDAIVTFDGTGSTDDVGIVAYAWAFGDGGTETGATPTHTYTAAGSFVAQLTVTDALGRTSSTTRPVVVVTPSPPSAHRVLRGTVTQLVPFAPGGDPATGRVPFVGAEITIGTGRQAPHTVADASGAYVFTNLTCPNNTCVVAVTAPGATRILLQVNVALGPDPSTTVRDFTVGDPRDLLFVAGQVVPPFTYPDEPPPVEPATVAIRVYRGNSNLLVDSAVTFGGPGSRGAYQLLIGRAGQQPLQVGTQLRIVLVENGVEGAQTTVQVPPLSGTFAPLVMTAADLVGQNPPPSAHRVLRGTVTQLVPFAPGGDPATGRVPFVGAEITIGTGRQAPHTVADASGAYVFTNLTCPNNTCVVAVTAPGATRILLQVNVALGPDPSTTVRDFTVGDPRDLLFVAGQVVPPFTYPDEPPPVEPATVAIRVYRGNSTSWPISAVTFGGPGSRGAYQLLIGRAGQQPLQVGTQLRIVLVENGVEGAQTTVQVPPLSGTFAPLVMTAADLVGQNPPPSAHRVLRGTVTQLVPFAPGGDPATGRVPFVGAEITIGTGRQAPHTVADASGAYVFTNLTCPNNTCAVAVTAPGATRILLQVNVALGPDPSTTVRDFTVGDPRDLLFVAGQVVPPFTYPDEPPPVEPATVAIRVYRGNSILADSAVTFGGPGSRGAYQLLIGRAGQQPLQVGTQLRIVLVENGVEGAQTTVQVPPLSGTFAPLVMTAADLVGE